MASVLISLAVAFSLIGGLGGYDSRSSALILVSSGIGGLLLLGSAGAALLALVLPGRKGTAITVLVIDAVLFLIGAAFLAIIR